MLKLLHTADLHLDAPFPRLGEREPDRREDFLKTFEYLVNLAIKNEVNLFLVAGDLFDNPRPADTTVNRVRGELKRLADRGIVPVLLPGTHDHLTAGDAVYRRETFPGAVVLTDPVPQDPVELSVGGETVYLYGFAYRHFVSAGALGGMARRFPEGVHLGLLHGSREGSPEWNYRAKDLPFTLPQLKSWNLDYVALGHYHGFEILEDEGRIHACYPGSPEGRRFGENGARFCALVTLAPGDCRVEPLTVNHRNLEERAMDLSGYEDFESVVDRICAAGNPDLLLRLTLTGILEAPLDLQALHLRCAGSFFHLDLIDRTRLFDSDYARRIGEEETVRGVFVRRAQQMIEELPEAERPTAEEALREVLVRFQAYAGEAS